MKKVLIVILVVLLLAAGAMGGYLWYQNTHIFVEDAVYAKNSQVLDLRGTGISEEHYLSVKSQLPECTILWDVPFQGGTQSNDITSLTITTLTDADRAMLQYFPNLTRVDATGCSDYSQLENLCRQLPECEVIYQVDLGGISVDPGVTELTLQEGEYDYAILMRNLIHLPQLQSLKLAKTELSVADIDNIRMEHGAVTVDYTVEILGQECGPDTTELDLSALTSEDVETVCTYLPMMVNLTYVELTPAQGASALTLEDVKTLNDACPNVVFHYTFSFNGKTLSTTDTTVQHSGSRIGSDVTEETLRLVLSVMENCEKFSLEYWNYGSLNNEIMAQIREDFRDQTKFVWRVFFGSGFCPTDVEVLRCTYDLTDKNSTALYYCEDVRFVDFGHSTILQDISFMAGMKKLEVAILSGSMAQDLTPLAGLENFRVLEASNCGYLADLSPLAQCRNLKMVNISFTSVTDLSPLDELDMEILCAVSSDLSKEEQERFVEVHPDCLTTYVGYEYGESWRYEEDGKKKPWYDEISVAFKYPDAPNMTGWYLS